MATRQTRDDTKYQTTEREARIVRDEEGRVGLTDHAIHRYRQRTPHDCRVSIREAWRRGEELQHPSVAGSLDQPNPKSARVYRHGDGWGVVFIVVESHSPDAGLRDDRAERVAVTTCKIRTFDHPPVRAYLRSHGPHGGAEK